MIRVAIAGCGHIAGSHMRTLRSIHDVSVVAACDIDMEQARTFAGRHAIRSVYDDITTLIQQTRPDVVHILTPPASHHTLALQVLEAGASALIEKPFARDAQEAADMVRIESRFPGTLSICHNYLYLPAMSHALRLIEQGKLGRVISADIYWRVSSLDTTRSDALQWLEHLPGGAFHEVGPHLIYLLRAVLGDLVCVSACQAGNDELRVQFRADDRLGTMAISTNEANIQKYLRIYGTRMSLHVDLAANVLIRLVPRGRSIAARALLNIETAGQLLAGTTGNVLRTLLGRMPRSHAAWIRAYYACIRQGLPPPVSSSDGLAVTAILDEVWSMR